MYILDGRLAQGMNKGECVVIFTVMGEYNISVLLVDQGVLPIIVEDTPLPVYEEHGSWFWKDKVYVTHVGYQGSETAIDEDSFTPYPTRKQQDV